MSTQTLEFPPLLDMELALYCKIRRIGPLRELIELENRKGAID
jgi:hypothetical protein